MRAYPSIIEHMQAYPSIIEQDPPDGVRRDEAQGAETNGAEASERAGLPRWGDTSAPQCQHIQA